MLFKRFIEGKSMLNADTKSNDRSPKKCFRRKSECEGCGEHSTILEEMTKMAVLGVVLWLGVSFGSHVAPYPLSLIVTTDIIHPPPMYDFPFPSAETLKRLPPVTTEHTNKSISLSKLTISMLQRLEDNLEASDIKPKSGSTALGLGIQGYPSNDAMKYEKSSTIITKASQNLVWSRCTRYGLVTDECASFISTLNLRESEYGPECAQLERFTCRTTKMSSKYRTFDGSCNNPVRSSWGQALTGYKRLLHPRYHDGISEPRRSVNHKELPSAREVSMVLGNNMDVPDNMKTMVLPVWSQFIFHDLVHTPVRKTIYTNQLIRCCDDSGSHLAPRYVHPSCMAITVSDRDPVLGKKSTCMEYTRSATTYRGDCTFGAAEQMNQASHFLDGSQIYGSNGKDAAALREKSGGLLKTITINDEELLPLSMNPTERCFVDRNSDACFNTGDVRSNMHPWLTSLHSLWVREHNRIAKKLAILNPAWKSDQLYHEARRIVVAEIQHITFRHWLPALTGKVFDELYESYDMGYNQDVDPTISNSFATAAFHFINSLLDQDIEVVDENNNVTVHRLGQNYFKPQMVTEKNSLENIFRGMTKQNSQVMDFNYDDDLRHHWLGGLGGLDVLAVDTQRGRDHGLAAYAHYRPVCGRPPPTTFRQLEDVMHVQTIKSLSDIYENPSDIDLVVGLMAEIPLEGSLIGPTATCLIREQLWRTRVGDRYFYTHTDEAGGFNKRQFAEIRHVSLSRLLCDNTDMKFVQSNVLQPPSDSNPIVSCDEIKKVSLEAWKDPSLQPDILTRTNKWIKNKVGSGNYTK